MYAEALAALTCPRHPARGLVLAPGARRDAEGAVLRGTLTCPACGARYRIADGIADLSGARTLPASLTQLVNYFPPTAWGYERIWRHRALTLLSGEPFGYERELPLITGLMEPRRAGLYLDVACSSGLYARALARARASTPGHVVGIDHALPMLRQARAIARQEGLRISYVRAKAQALPFATAALAGITMGGSLNEIGDADAALREVRRTLAGSGRCVMMNLGRATSKAGRGLQQLMGPGGVAFWPLEELNRRFAAAGLRRVGQWRYRVVVFSLLVPERTSTSSELP